MQAAVIRRGWPLLVLFVVLGLLGGLGTALLVTPRFDATARVFIAATEGDTPLGSLALTYYARDRLPSYAEVATSAAVLRPVALELGLDDTPAELASRVEVRPLPDSLILEIVGSSLFNTEAPRLADAVARKLAEVIELQLEARMTGQGSALRVQVIESPAVSLTPAYPVLGVAVGTGAVAGLLMGFGVMLLRNTFDHRVRGVDDVREATTTRVVGTVSPYGRDDVLTVALDDEHPCTMQYRALRTDLHFLGFQARNRAVLLVGASRSQGTTDAAVNFASVMAGLGRRVLLVDACLGATEIVDLLGLSRGLGLTDVLAGRAKLDDAVQTWPEVRDVTVLGAGGPHPNSRDLLGSDRMRELLAELAERYDDVVIDGGRAIAPDARALAGLAGTTLLVVRARHVTVPRMLRAITALQPSGSFTGILITEQPSRGADAAAEAVA
ncbi:MAG: hypothetical protein WAK00_07375 [Microbacterium sp.]|uniref:hypothetical protein n=1 Tax=Microbacterium sp. TaxID=51671 RepID=UPI003BAE2843